MIQQDTISILIPLYNETDNLIPLYKRISDALKEENIKYEIIFVNDGSNDNSLEILERLHHRDYRVKIISFTRNFGHQIALSAGIDFSVGNAVIMMDADLQHPPELIPKMIRLWKTDYEIVNCIRQENKDVNKFKKYSSDFFYKFFNKISQSSLPGGSSDFRLIDQKVVNTIKNLKERSRFLRGLIYWTGYNHINISYKVPKRQFGKSKYSIIKMIKLAINGITSFSTFPLRISTYIGISVTVLSFIYAVYAILMRIFSNKTITGWTSLLVTILFLGGIQLLSIGVIGEYISKIFQETKQRPLYIIHRKVGFDK